MKMNDKVTFHISGDPLNREDLVYILTTVLIKQLDNTVPPMALAGKVDEVSAAMLFASVCQATGRNLIQIHMRASPSSVEFITRLQELVNKQVDRLFAEATVPKEEI